MGNFNILYSHPGHKILCNRKQLTKFVDDHINIMGDPVMVCNGTVYAIEWKSKGAGMYEVFLTDNIKDYFNPKLKKPNGN